MLYHRATSPVIKCNDPHPHPSLPPPHPQHRDGALDSACALCQRSIFSCGILKAGIKLWHPWAPVSHDLKAPRPLAIYTMCTQTGGACCVRPSPDKHLPSSSEEEESGPQAGSFQASWTPCCPQHAFPHHWLQRVHSEPDMAYSQQHNHLTTL